MKKVLDEGKLLLIAIPVLVWTLLPIYHLFVLSISNQESMLAASSGPTSRRCRTSRSSSTSSTTT